MSKHALYRRYRYRQKYMRKLWQGTQESKANLDSTESFIPAQDKKQKCLREKKKKKVTHY